jgi:hypothetical protein
MSIFLSRSSIGSAPNCRPKGKYRCAASATARSVEHTFPGCAMADLCFHRGRPLRDLKSEPQWNNIPAEVDIVAGQRLAKMSNWISYFITSTYAQAVAVRSAASRATPPSTSGGSPAASAARSNADNE